MKKILFRPGLLNVLEHGITRASDAATSLVLIWSLPVELYGKIAYAQAVIAPLAFLFIAQDLYIYRTYSTWKQEGRTALEGAHRLMDRIIGLKFGIAILLSLILSIFRTEGSSISQIAAFGIFVWAFASVLLTHWLGPDREFLRLGGKFLTLNRITLFQKLSVFAGVIIAVRWLPDSLAWLAPLWIGSIIITKFVLSLQVRKLHREFSTSGESRKNSASFYEAFFGLSLWNHLAGSIYLFGQTMDLFFLGIFHTDARMISLYSVALKYSNFFTFLPYALANTFNVQAGNVVSGSAGAIEQRSLFARSFPRYLGIVIAQTVVFLIAAPWIFEYSSQGKWTSDEIAELVAWFRTLVIAQGLHVFPLLWWALSQLRTPVSKVALQIYVPWGIVCLGVYSWAAQTANPLLLAQMNIVTSAFFCAVVIFYHRRNDRDFYRES